nr:putative acyltransferase [Quercus suber]
MRVVRQDAKRRIAFLIAAKSMKRAFIGFAAGLVGSVPVGRALDLKKPAQGKIYLPKPEDDPSLIKGTDTNFDADEYQPGGLLVLPTVNNTAANAEIAEILGPNEIRLKKPFKGDVALKQLTGKDIGEGNGHLPNGASGEEKTGEQFEGTRFSMAPHVDQGAVYDAVFKRIRQGGCIGIFPEGGSHDRTDLLPLKAGLAIMALGSLAEDPNCGVTIVPVGMNYFHAHKFRSRAVIEFGAPIEIDPMLVEQYKDGDRRGATAKVLEIVYERLAAVTTQAPDYDTLMLIQAVRRLYNPKGKHLPLSMVVELNRRLLKGYNTYKDDPRIQNLKRSVLDYHRTLFRLNVRDHQLSYAKFSWYQVVFTLIYRVAKLTVLSVAVLPGLVLFSPIFITGKVISNMKAKEALAASSVKVKARDVVATWKILVSLALAPTLNGFYNFILMYWVWYDRIGGQVPNWVPLWLVCIFGIFFFPAVCFAALRFGEIGLDIFKSLRPLMLSINPGTSNTFVKLRETRQKLQEQVNDIINELGPELFQDFDHQRIISDPTHPLHSPERSRPSTPSRVDGMADRSALSFTPATSAASSQAHLTGTSNLPPNESFSNIGSVAIFATRPGTPNRSRSRSHGRGDPHDGSSTTFSRQSGAGFSSMTQSSNMEQVSKNLHDAMRARGRRRKGEEDNDDDDGEWEVSGSGADLHGEDYSEDFEPEQAKKDL